MSRATSTIPVTHTTRYSAVHFAHFLSTTLFDWSRSIRSMMSATASVTYGHHADAKMATPLANTEYGGGGGGSPLSGLGRHEGVLHHPVLRAHCVEEIEHKILPTHGLHIGNRPSRVKCQKWDGERPCTTSTHPSSGRCSPISMPPRRCQI